MKQLLAITALSFCFAIAVSAQETPLQPQKPKKEINFKKELNLTQDQQNQWKSLNQEYRQKMLAVKNNSSFTDAQRKEQYKSLGIEKRTKLNSILTADQQAKMAEMRKKHSGGKKQATPVAQLNLSQEQQKQWKDLNREYGQKFVALRNNKNLTDDQRRQQFKSLADERKTKFNSILTSEQQAKFATMNSQRIAKAKSHYNELNLSQTQQEQWKSINKEYRDKMMALNNNKALADADRKAQFKNLAKEKNDKIKAILNSDQQAKFAELKKERRAQFKKPGISK